MSDLVVQGGRVLAPDGWDSGDVVVAGGRMADRIGGECPTLDARELLVAPGFVDLQCNGAAGIDVTSEPDGMWEVGRLLPRWGVTAWLPTVVTSPSTTIDRALDALAAGPPSGWIGAIPLGLHLEGPFLAPGAAGAHDRDLLREPTLAAIDGWTRDAGVALVTLAPELPGALDVVRELVQRGIVVALGHSLADETEVRAAIEAGATMVTHLFNAMAPLHHRAPGLAGVALHDERVAVGLIVDGVHVHPDVVAIAQRSLGERLVLVTDAVAALGAEASGHRLGAAEVGVAGGVVRLADGTLAGSALSMDAAVRNLVSFSGCEPAAALRAASATPATLLGDSDRGRIAAGARGDLVLLTPELDVVATVIGGEVVHGQV